MPFFATYESFLIGTMLLLALVMVSRMRLGSLVELVRAQAVALSLLAFFLAYKEGEAELIVVAILVLVLKAGLIPQFLLRTAEAGNVSRRLQSYLRPTTLSFAGVALVAFSFVAVRTVVPQSDDYFLIAASFSLVLLGLLALVTRRDMFGQGVGFLMMENGIFTFGVTLSGGMPLLVEIGILFDLLILFILVGGLARRAQEEHASLGTDYLRELTD